MASDSAKFSSIELQKPENEESSRTSMRKMITVASIAAGVQFGWALQLSLLTPYVQLLGVPHTWSSFIWLCGPISGLLVQPLVGYFSDSSTSRFGRRRPFIAGGAVLVILAVILIGFAADFGHMAGDRLDAPTKTRAVVLFVIGFWVLDVANNMLQGPCRAFLADLSNGDPNKTRAANAFYSFFMAVGNVLGYGAGSYTSLYKAFPFTKTVACDVYCANLKSCFILSIILLLIVTITALTTVSEKPPSKDVKEIENGGFFFTQLFRAFKELPRPMWILLLVTCLNWIAWFPFILYDTDWMGKEIYGGQVGQGKAYDLGVRAGAIGLLLNSVVLGFTSLGIDFLSRGANGVKRLWGVVNFVLAICLAMTVLVTKAAEHTRRYGPDGSPLPPTDGVKAGALTIFSALGIPLAVTYSIPFALASIYCMSSGGGQGLSLGVLNLSIVIPQMVVSVASGPWDALFGGGNLPAFVFGAVAAAVSGLLALFLLPTPPSRKLDKATSFVGGH